MLLSAKRADAIRGKTKRVWILSLRRIPRPKRLADGQQLMAHVPSHHDHKLGEWIGIRALVDHVVTFERM
jgi:hypothetical protein